MRTSDVLIAGAGIIGLSAALEFAAHGLSVTVLEQGAAMREASWAAAGMLAAGDPENPPQLRAFADFSLSLYPTFLSTIERLSGLAVPLRTRVTLQGLHRFSHPGSRSALLELEPASLDAHAPALLPGPHSFFELPEHSLDPRDLCRALPLAAEAAGIALRERTAVISVQQRREHVRITSSQGDFAASHYVHCTGAWAGILRLPGGAEALPVEPRKGQILAVTMPADAPALTCVLRTPELYLVPRGNAPGETGQRIVIGATVEHSGFDRSVTDSATEALMAAAAALWPPIRLGKVGERWSGLRPATPDGLPIVSEFGGDPASRGESRQWVATGHFRNGILLAPGTARLLAQLSLGQQPSVDMHAFRAARFAAIEAVP